MKKNWIVSLCTGMAFAAAAQGTDLWKTPEKTWTLDQYASWQKDHDGNTMMKVEIPSGIKLANHTYGCSFKLDLTPYRGKMITLSAEIKGDDIVYSKVEPHYCPKILMSYRSKGQQFWTASGNISTPTFDWRKFEVNLMVTDFIKDFEITVGLQATTGTLWVRKVKLLEMNPYPAPISLPEGFRCEYSDAILNAPILRGVAAPFNSQNPEKDIADLAAWNVNAVRYWVEPEKKLRNHDIRCDQAFERELNRLDKLLPFFAKYKIRVIVVLATPGGMYQDPIILGTAGKLAENENPASDVLHRIFMEDFWLNKFLATWGKIARRYQHNPTVWGYDLLNEPVQVTSAKVDYLKAQYLAAKEIRTVDPEKPIIVSANDWSSPDAFSYLKPLPLKNIFYQVHMYVPGSYTHQGVGEGLKNMLAGKILSYPGKIDGIDYNRDVLRDVLQPVRQFQKKYGAKIYAGEFSVFRTSPGGAIYLDDVCSIFEDYGWSWTYHAYREWDKWSLEHSSTGLDDMEPKPVTDRLTVMKKYYAKNIR